MHAAPMMAPVSLSPECMVRAYGLSLDFRNERMWRAKRTSDEFGEELRAVPGAVAYDGVFS